MNNVRMRKMMTSAYPLCIVAIAVAALLLVTGCPPALPAGDFGGVTAGGAQDIAQAREIIMNGGIPQPEAISVEGLMSEHSIEINAAANPTTLYATATAAWNNDFDSFTSLATIALGFGTDIDLDTFERSPLNLALVIDASGSMDDVLDSRTNATKMTAVKVAIDRLLAHLTADDLVTVVQFKSDPTTLIEAVAGNDIAAIKTALDDIQPGGATDLARGMIRGYARVKANSSSTRLDRIIVLTDAVPTSGTTSAEDMLDAMEQYAADDIGATILGVGVNFGSELAYDISQVRGGNFFFLSTYDRIVSIFDEEFKFMVTPVAYDVNLTITIPFEFDMDSVYGLPEPDAISHVQELDVPTLFLSSRQGGGVIMARARAGALASFDQPQTLATIALSYTEPDGETNNQALTVTLPSGLDPTAEEPYFETEGTRRAVLLLNTALVLKNACDDATQSSYRVDPNDDRDVDRAIARITEFLPYFDELALGLIDQPTENSRSLSEERELLIKLLSNIQGFPYSEPVEDEDDESAGEDDTGAMDDGAGNDDADTNSEENGGTQ